MMSERFEMGMENNGIFYYKTNAFAKLKHNVFTLPNFVGLILILTALTLFGVVYVVDSILPTPLFLADEEMYPNSFITQRARYYLKSLTDIGPRVAGTYENEVLAIEVLTSHINSIITKSNENQKIEIDMQVTHRNESTRISPYGIIFDYFKTQNIAVKLHASENVPQTILVNAHFDSAPTSPGGSDDGINCAIMLEVLKKLSQEAQRPLNNIIFLFNGAEEIGLIGSRAFVEKHKWAKDCKIVVNLEAIGAGGKIILFQAGPDAGWLMNYYGNVPHPYAQVIAEELFQNRLIPAGTDFEIFTKYGGMVGLDMAFFKNGERYHTKDDGFDNIPLGSFQHAGDNILSLVKNLANAPEVIDPKKDPGKFIYFDFLGIFFIHFSEEIVFIINYIVAFSSFTVFLFNIYIFKNGFHKAQLVKSFLLTFGVIFGGWIIATLFVYILTLIIYNIGHGLRWSRQNWIIFGLYAAPTVALSSALLLFKQSTGINCNVKRQMQAHCIRIIWTLVLLFGTILNVRSVYILMLPILFSTAVWILIYLLRLQDTRRLWVIMYVTALVTPSTLLMYESLLFYSLYIPIVERLLSYGIAVNFERTIGMFTVVFVILISSSFVALIDSAKDVSLTLITLVGMFIASFIIIFTPIGNADVNSNYLDPATPNDYWILHTRRILHNNHNRSKTYESGYVVVIYDAESNLKFKNFLKDNTATRNVEEDCKTYVLCGLPFVHSESMIQNSIWVPTKEAFLFTNDTQLEIVNKTGISPTTFRYYLTMSSMASNSSKICFSPKPGTIIRNTSLIEAIPGKEEETVWNNRSLFCVKEYNTQERLVFTLDVEMLVLSNEPTVEVAITDIYENDYAKSANYGDVQFMSNFPQSSTVIKWYGSYQLWLI